MSAQSPKVSPTVQDTPHKEEERRQRGKGFTYPPGGRLPGASAVAGLTNDVGSARGKVAGIHGKRWILIVVVSPKAG
jgi:hypothetical protein